MTPTNACWSESVECLRPIFRTSSLTSRQARRRMHRGIDGLPRFELSCPPPGKAQSSCCLAAPSPPIIHSSNNVMNRVSLRILTSLARLVLVGVSLLLFIPLVPALLIDIGNRSTAVTQWPPSGNFVRSLVLLICLPMHTIAAIRHWHNAFPLYAALSAITAGIAVIGTDAGTFFFPTALCSASVLYWGTRCLQP